MNEPLSTRVTKIGSKWYCRLLRDDVVIDEIICEHQQDIGYCIHQMLRWYHKLGKQPYSQMAEASRHRNKPFSSIGKIVYKHRNAPDKNRILD